MLCFFGIQAPFYSFFYLVRFLCLFRYVFRAFHFRMRNLIMISLYSLLHFFHEIIKILLFIALFFFYWFRIQIPVRPFWDLLYQYSVFPRTCSPVIYFIFKRRRFRYLHFRDQILFVQAVTDSLINPVVNLLLIAEAKFHFCRVYVDIDLLWIHLNVKRYKRIFMLHRKIFVCVFNPFRQDVTADISSVYKIVFKISISAGDKRFSKKSINTHPFTIIFHREQIIGNLSSVNMINHIF